MSTKHDFLKILEKHLSLESRWFLVILSTQTRSISKIELQKITNEEHFLYAQKIGEKDIEPLISSRHALDIHTARLEGGGLVIVDEVGKMRLYKISPLGQELIQYISP